MLIEPAMAEFLSFLSAIMIAATVTATARGLAEREKEGLRAFKKFYIDLAGAFSGLVLLSAGGPTSWTTSPMLTSITSLDGAATLLPLVVALLLVVLLVARHRWGRRTRRADLVVTLVVASVIIVAAMGLTSRPAVAEGFDRTAQRLFSSYCSKHSSGVADLLKLADGLLIERKSPPAEGREGKAEPKPPTDLRLQWMHHEQTPLIEVMVHDGEVVSVREVGGAWNRARMGPRARKKVQGEFCDAVAIYLAARATQD